MGKIKEKLQELTELVNRQIRSGKTEHEVDEYIRNRVSTDVYAFYETYKDEIMDNLYTVESKEEILMPKLNEEKRDYSELHPLSDLKFNFNNWASDENDEEDAETLTHILQQRHPDYDPDEIRQMVYDWCKIDDNIDESYKEDSFNEEFFYNQSELDDYNDGLSDYEWRVGSAVTSQLNDSDIDFNEERLSDALRNKSYFMIKCMKDGLDELHCAEELINDEEFMSEIESEGFDKGQTYDDMYDSQDEPIGRNLIIGEIDESYIMPRLSEGCNCGGKKRPTLLPNGKAPLITRRPTNRPSQKKLN